MVAAMVVGGTRAARVRHRLERLVSTIAVPSAATYGRDMTDQRDQPAPPAPEDAASAASEPTSPEPTPSQPTSPEATSPEPASPEPTTPEPTPSQTSSPQPTPAQPAARQPAAVPAPPPAGTGTMAPAEEVTWSTLSHLSWLAGALIGLPPLGPLVAYLALRDRGPFVRFHSAQALNFQLSLFVYVLAVGLVGGVLTAVTLGAAFPLLLGGLVVLAILGLVLSIMAAIAASRGQWYRYPVTIGFVR